MKGHDHLLRAFATHFRGDPGVRLRIGGDGPERWRLEALAAELGLEKQIDFLGWLGRDQVVREMQHANVFVLPSRYETFGVVLIEALACGKPVIATRCGGPERIVHDGNGILVSPESHTELADAMQRLRVTTSEFDSKAIRADCLTRFGEQRVIGQLGELYEHVAGQAR